MAKSIEVSKLEEELLVFYRALPTQSQVALIAEAKQLACGRAPATTVLTKEEMAEFHVLAERIIEKRPRTRMPALTTTINLAAGPARF